MLCYLSIILNFCSTKFRQREDLLMRKKRRAISFIFQLILALSLCLMLIACGNEEDAENDTNKFDEETISDETVEASTDETVESEMTDPMETEDASPEETEESTEESTTSEVDVTESENSESSETPEIEEQTPNFTVEDMTETVMYVQKNVNVRKGPGTEYEKVGSLTINKSVEVTGKTSNGWYRISYNGIDAYVSGNYLGTSQVVIETQPPATSTPQPDGSGSENASGGGTTPSESTTNPSESVPSEASPSGQLSADEAIQVVKSVLNAGGMTDVGGDHGMGWAEVYIGLDPTQCNADASALLSAYQYGGYKYYYIDNLGIVNGEVHLRVYYGGKSY